MNIYTMDKITKIFEHFPSDQHCILCGSYIDKPCILASVDGIGDNRVIEARPIHIDCLHDGMKVNVGLGIVYKQFIK
jgi:hypothetical protein